MNRAASGDYTGKPNNPTRCALRSDRDETAARAAVRLLELKGVRRGSGSSGRAEPECVLQELIVAVVWRDRCPARGPTDSGACDGVGEDDMGDQQVPD